MRAPAAAAAPEAKATCSAFSAPVLERVNPTSGSASLTLNKSQSDKTAAAGFTSVRDTSMVAAPKAGKGLLVLTTGGKMSAYGPGSRFGVLHGEFGIVPAVEGLAPGDHVVMSFRSCRSCAQCKAGLVGYCESTLLLNYMGQAAMLLRHPEFVDNPFFHMVPPALTIPM